MQLKATMLHFLQRLLVGAAIPLTMLGLLRFEDEADRTAGFAACSMIAFILCCLVGLGASS
jgi:hypothetical protein